MGALFAFRAAAAPVRSSANGWSYPMCNGPAVLRSPARLRTIERLNYDPVCFSQS